MSNYHAQPHDMYHDNTASRSPGSQRQQQQQQQLHRQSSRQFDAYGPITSGLYDDAMARYDSARLDRLTPTIQNNNYNYDMPGSQTWNTNGFQGAHTLSGIPSAGGTTATGRLRSNPRGRTGIPTTWLDQQPTLASPFTLPPGPLPPTQVRQDNISQEADDELIPTAIVIKNIPFAVKKEQLVHLMTELNLPLPYAFNYHFDNGVFRGLAFANFTSAEETATVIEVLNHFELQGRKLRVEYKKMLPLQERERIEREKRERRGQLEEQHRPMPNSQLQTQNSMSSLTSHLPATSPSPVSQRTKLDVDMNDAETLSFYSQLLLFKQDLSRETLIFPAELTPLQRRTVHTLSHNMGLAHTSCGTGDQRQVHVYHIRPGSNISPSATVNPATIHHHTDSSRRGLNRAATIDFSEARGDGPNPFGAVRGNNSNFLNVLDSSPSGFGTAQNLRAAKSFADLRSYTPSPAPSSASYPAALQSNGARLQPYDGTTSAASTTPTLTPTPPGGSFGVQRDDHLLVNNLSGLSLGTIGGPNSGSPRRLRGMFSWDDSQPSTTAPIGSNRSIGLGFDSQPPPQERIPLRQPRGPAPERGSGFRRQNGHQTRGSDELRSQVEIIVE